LENEALIFLTDLAFPYSKTETFKISGYYQRKRSQKFKIYLL